MLFRSERRFEQRIQADAAGFADLVFEHAQKAQLLAVQPVALGKIGKTGFYCFGVHADDAAQDVRQRRGGVGIEFAQHLQVNPRMAGVNQAVELVKLGIGDTLAITVARDGQMQTVSLTLGEKNASNSGNGTNGASRQEKSAESAPQQDPQG